MVSVQSTRTMLLLVTPMLDVLYLFNVPIVTTTTTMGVTMDREKGHIYWTGHWKREKKRLKLQTCRITVKACMAQLYK